MSELTACQRLDIIRHKGRPTAKDYIPLIFDDFFEMHGDRLFGDDGAVMGGIAYFKGIPVTVIAEVRVGILQKIRSAISVCHTRRAIERLSGLQGRLRSSIDLLYALLIQQAHSAA